MRVSEMKGNQERFFELFFTSVFIDLVDAEVQG